MSEPDHEHVVSTGKSELTFAELGAMQPGMARIMTEVGVRIWKCYYAGQAHNVPLARFQLKEAVGLMNTAGVVRPKYRDDLRAFIEGIVAMLMKTIDEQDWEQFDRLFHNMVRAANGYHAAYDKPWLRWKIPEMPPPDLDLTPLP